MTDKAPFSYAPNPGIGGGFRVQDERDNRVATCYVEDHARAVVFALNAMNGPIEWTCGHVARACCADCHAALIRKATTFVDIIDALLDRLDVNDEVAKAQRSRLTSTLQTPISPAEDHTAKRTTTDER